MRWLDCTGICKPFSIFVDLIDYFIDGFWDILSGRFSASGLDRFEARKKLWADLEETGLAVKKEQRTMRVPRSQRGGEV